MRYGLIGQPLGHSFSPRIHSLLGNSDYTLCPLQAEEVEGFLSKRAFEGINVTIPYKQTVIPFLDEITARAREIGSVNTVIKRRDGRLFGDNTDWMGFESMLNLAKVELKGRKVAILGSGGTSHTALAVATQQEAREILVVSRQGKVCYENLSEHRDIEVLINTTPVGMYPHTNESPLDLRGFPHLHAVLDVIYNPLKTRLILQAEDLGIPSASGLIMLVNQAVAADALFFDRPTLSPDADRAYQTLLREGTNLILIGMPGSGKSRVAEMVAKALGRECLDTDQLVEAKVGMKIADIFSAHGEAHFRALETEAVAESCLSGGKVISVGGGAVMREENRLAMRSNGRLYYMDRPLHLLATRGRPLSASGDHVKNLFETRRAVYEQLKHRTILNHTTLDEAADQIKEDFLCASW